MLVDMEACNRLQIDCCLPSWQYPTHGVAEIRPSIKTLFSQYYDTDCFQIVIANGDIIEWANSIRYLGVYFVSGRLLNATGTMPNLVTIVLLTPYSDVLVDLRLYKQLCI